jgi:L-lactate dehydrogenase complex protein LldG
MTGNSGGARERILGRIREAMERAAGDAPQPVALDEIFAPIENVRERFLAECAANVTEVVETVDARGSASALLAVLESLPAGEVYVQDAPALRDLLGRAAVSRTLRSSSQGAPAESTQAAVTLAHGFVAQTGSILVSSQCGGRGASIVPPCHIVYGRGEQLVSGIAEALALAEAAGLTEASYAGLISGSSRTSDIEKMLVQGAHGPRRLVVILEG